jgi:large subunit ribosomal protein L2
MAIVRSKPTSAGRRFRIEIKGAPLHTGEPWPSLVEKSNPKSGGRNTQGHITSRRRGGGHKRRYRRIDFKRGKEGVPATVERFEYDPNRSAHLALLKFADGERRYIIAPKGLKQGAPVRSGRDAPIKPGNAMPLANVPLGTRVHCVELKPGRGAQMARSAGASVQLVAREGAQATLRLRSGEMRRVPVGCRATIGEVGNEEHSLSQHGKAGARRWKGKRPVVRGVSMNPIDHPHGGGEGHKAGGRHPVSPWGQPTKGYKTRKNKSTDKNIIRRRKRKK